MIENGSYIMPASCQLGSFILSSINFPVFFILFFLSHIEL